MQQVAQTRRDSQKRDRNRLTTIPTRSKRSSHGSYSCRCPYASPAFVESNQFANGYAESTNAYHRNGGLNVQSWRSGSQRVLGNRPIKKSEWPRLIRAMTEDGLHCAITVDGLHWTHGAYTIEAKIIREV